MTLRFGTRASVLATTQTRLVADRLAELADVKVDLVEISTEGDRSQAAGTSLVGAPSTGVFVSALREALLAGEVDVAVHSLKDLPTYPEQGVALAAVPQREDPRDVLVARDGLTLGELPHGSVVGTGSPRRAAQLEALGLGVDVRPVRGNVDTRVGKVTSGEYDAVVIARAGLARLGRLEEATEVLDPLQMLPAPGQGALAIECRADDAATLATLALLDDPASRAAVAAERATLATLEGGCAAPIGALADLVEGDTGPELWLRAVALSPDGALAVRTSGSTPLGDDPATWSEAAIRLGERLATEMLDDGARELSSVAPPSAARSVEVHEA